MAIPLTRMGTLRRQGKYLQSCISTNLLKGLEENKAAHRYVMAIGDWGLLNHERCPVHDVHDLLWLKVYIQQPRSCDRGKRSRNEININRLIFIINRKLCTITAVA